MDRIHSLLIVSAATASLCLSACSEEEATPELDKFADCEALDAWLDTSAATQVNYSYNGFGGPVARGGDVALEDSGGAVPPASPQDGGTGGDDRSYSSTNVQVDGVDEADMVKNDGEHIYLVDGEGLNILDAWPVNELRSLSYTAIEGAPLSLYFDGLQTVVVFSQIWGESARPESGLSSSKTTRWPCFIPRSG